MQQVRAQNEENIPGIQQFRYRYWPESKWQEKESLTVGRPFYEKRGTKEQASWTKPPELKDNDEFIEELRDYKWQNQVNFLKDADNGTTINDKEMKSESFQVITNTFPIELSKDMNVLEYEIQFEPVEVTDDLGFKSSEDPRSIDVQKLFKRCICYLILLHFVFCILYFIFCPISGSNSNSNQVSSVRSEAGSNSSFVFLRIR